jgi:hypothetical protein
MDFDYLIAELAPPPNRRGKAKDGQEHRFYEGAVMLAYAMHLLETENTREVRVHPDGMHGKQFDFPAGFIVMALRAHRAPGRRPMAGLNGQCRTHHRGQSEIRRPRSGPFTVNESNRVADQECICCRQVNHSRQPAGMDALFDAPLCSAIDVDLIRER